MAGIQVYQKSMRFRGSAIPMGFLYSLAAGVLGAYLYTLFQSWVPFIYLNIVAAIGFGALIGIAAGWALKKAHCRNTLLAVIIAAAGAIAGEGVSYWLSYEDLVDTFAASEGIPAEDLKAEFGILDYVALRIDTGYTIGRASSSSNGPTVSGWVMVLVMLAEVLIVLGSAIGFAVSWISVPYCERCSAWTKSRTLGEILGVDESSLNNAMSREDLPSAMRPVFAEGSDKRLEYQLHQCDTCNETSYLTLTLKWLEGKKGKKNEEKSTMIVKYALVTPEEVENLRTLFTPPAEPAPEPQPEV